MPKVYRGSCLHAKSYCVVGFYSLSGFHTHEGEFLAISTLKGGQLKCGFHSQCSQVIINHPLNLVLRPLNIQGAVSPFHPPPPNPVIDYPKQRTWKDKDTSSSIGPKCYTYRLCRKWLVESVLSLHGILLCYCDEPPSALEY